MPEPRPVAIYSRKSRFTGQGESIENQIGICRRYVADRFGPEAAAGALVYEDEGFSGGSLERPRFRQMMREAERRPFRALVVYRLDRVSRNIGDFARLIQELEAKGIAFVSVREQFDTSTPLGRAMMYISSVFSQLERETIAERIRDNMLELAKSGRWLGGVTPTGYRSETTLRSDAAGRPRRCCRLVVQPREAELVRLIFARFLTGGSVSRTAELLTRAGHTSRSGRPLTRFALRAILTNPVYMLADADAWRYFRQLQAAVFAGPEDFDGRRGVMVYNRTRQEPGRAARLRPPAEWIVARGEHEGLVEGREWVRAQLLLELGAGDRCRHEALLGGMLVCGCCGGGMRARLLRHQQGGAAHYYLCTVRESSRGRQCQVKNCGGEAADRAALDLLRSLPEDGAEFRRQLKRSAEMMWELPDTAAEAAGSPPDLPALVRLARFSAAVDGMSRLQRRAALRTLLRRAVWDGGSLRLELRGSDGAAPSGADSK